MTDQTATQDDVNAYLDAVRETGAVNMLHGPRLIREEYGLEKARSVEMFKAWTQTYPRRDREGDLTDPEETEREIAADMEETEEERKERILRFAQKHGAQEVLDFRLRFPMTE